MIDTGHTREALARIGPLLKASPLAPWIRAANIDLLAAADRLEDADRAATAAFAIWPRDPLIWFTCFDLAAFNGQPDRALAMATDRAGWPKLTDQHPRTVPTARYGSPADVKSWRTLARGGVTAHGRL